MFRMPPSSGDDHALRSDFSVAGQVLADDIDVVEAALIDGQDSRVANAAWLEAAELRPLQSEVTRLIERVRAESRARVFLRGMPV